MTKEDLIDFENEFVERFERGEIKSPLHLAGGNEQQLIDIFKNVNHDDWALCSWRAHYHCLLKGVPVETVRRAILDGRSIALCFPGARILSSAIVGGIAPIAIGVAWAIKREGGKNKVHVFLGDMTAESGVVYEAMKYAAYHALPINWIIEDNGISVCTNTEDAWGMYGREFLADHAKRYRHELTRPHVGIGRHVSF